MAKDHAPVNKLFASQGVSRVTQEAYDKLHAENAKLKQELQEAYETLETQRSVSTKRQDCPLCKMNEPPMRVKGCGWEPDD